MIDNKKKIENSAKSTKIKNNTNVENKKTRVGCNVV